MIGRSLSNALASATRCSCPPLNGRPPPPIGSSRPLGRSLIKESRPAAAAACSTLLFVASGVLKRMLSFKELLKMYGFCGIYVICSRQPEAPRSPRVDPLSSKLPCVGRRNPPKMSIKVDFPAPLSPIIPILPNPLKVTFTS
ncbi:hypothetical protein D3C76_1332130 [compost metagenome]